MKNLANSKKNFWLWLSIFSIISILVIIAKKLIHVKDFITNDNIILIISPLLFILSMLLAYGLYDRIIKQAKGTQVQQIQIAKFTQANRIKFIFLAVGGIIISLTLFLIWKPDYLYLLGIALILFLIAYPNKTKLDIEFDNFNKDKNKEENIETQEAEN